MACIKCEICGASDLLKINDLFVCQRCGTKYTAEDARKLFIDDDDQSVCQDKNEMSYSEDEPSGFPKDNSEEQVKEESLTTKDFLSDNETDKSPIHISSVYTHLGIRPGEVVFENAPVKENESKNDNNTSVDNRGSNTGLELVECVQCHGLIRKEAKYCRLCGIKNPLCGMKCDTSQKDSLYNSQNNEEKEQTLTENDKISHKKKKSKTWIIIVSAIFVLAVGIIVYLVASGSLSGIAVSSNVNESLYDPVRSGAGMVYVDIVSATPAYIIRNATNNTIDGYVVKCRSDKGYTIWVYCSVDDYKLNFDDSISTNSNNKSNITITFSPAVRIHGFVTSTSNIDITLELNIHNSTVFRFKSMDK